MSDILVFPAGTGEASSYAVQFLKDRGISAVYHPTPDVTHLLLDVPAKDVPAALLERLPEGLCVVGGNLNLPVLDGYRKLDLLQNEEYLAKNAAVTAECALRVALQHHRKTLCSSAILIIGWGRIGKCLAALLKSIGCKVTVFARKSSDLAILDAMGYGIVPGNFDIIFNTVPGPVLDAFSYPDALKIDLASRRGLDGSDVIWARGLPGLYVPKSSGQLIAETFLKEVKP